MTEVIHELIGQSAGTDSFRTVMGSFATGVTIVTVAPGNGNIHGMTVSSFSSVSADPPLVLVCLNQSSRGLALIERSAAFAVNVLSSGQQDLSRWFANQRRPADSTMFDGVRFALGAVGCPVLLDAAAWFDCRLRQLHRAGDHLIVLGEVVALGRRPEMTPLLVHAGKYRQLAREDVP